MYVVLLVPYHGEAALVTAFNSRREFLIATNLENSPTGWAEACRYERAVFEITSAQQIEGVLHEVSSYYPDYFDACAVRIAEWVEHQAVDAVRTPGLS